PGDPPRRLGPRAHVRPAGRAIPSRHLRAGGIRAQARAQGRVARARAREVPGRADESGRARPRRAERSDAPRLGRARLARLDGPAGGARRGFRARPSRETEGNYLGDETTRRYGFSVLKPCGYFFFASSSDTVVGMITSCPGFQFTGVATP